MFVDQFEAVGLLGGDATELARAQRFGLRAHEIHRRLERIECLRQHRWRRVQHPCTGRSAVMRSSVPGTV